GHDVENMNINNSFVTTINNTGTNNHGIYIDTGNNVFINNSELNISKSGIGIWLRSITNNLIENSQITVNGSSSSSGIYYSGSGGNNLTLNNLTINMFLYSGSYGPIGIDFASSTNNVIINNS